MDGAMGMEEEVVEAVLTCEGDFHDPELLKRLEKFRLKLRDLLLADENKLNLKKVEPWNSVKVTFTIPKEAALRLRQLAQSGNDTLRQMGVLSVQLQGDSSISLKIAGVNNETTELTLHTSKSVSDVGSLPSEHGVNNSSEIGSSPGPSNEEVTRKNIVDYLIQGPPHVGPNAVFNSFLGANASAGAPFLGPSRGIPSSSSEPFSGLRNSRPPLHPNSIANMTSLSSPVLRGSPHNSFPFAKTTGAFHIPIPHQSSAGRSVGGIPNNQMTSFPANKNITNLPGHMNASGLQQHGGSQTQQKNMPVTVNTFGSVSSKLPNSSNISSSLPSSSSPGFMIDLPPPPPYPHSSGNNSNKSGQPVSASSPLLVNLLQTDPIAVAAAMSSASNSKTATTGSTSPAQPVKKKKRQKKTKESVPGSFSNMDDINLMDTNPPMFNPAFSMETNRVPGVPLSSAPFSSVTKTQRDYIQGNTDIFVHGVSHVHKSESKTISDKTFKPLISSDRPFSENSIYSPAFSQTKLITSVGSAIGSDSRRSNKANGQGELSQEIIDSFSREIAAGKIINPYTGQLESRDSILESSSGKLKDQINVQEEVSSRVVSNKIEIGSSNFSNVPISASQVKDVNVLKNLSTVSSSTAACFNSGSSPHISSDKFPLQTHPHRKMLSDNNSVSTKKDIYAAKPESEHPVIPFSSSVSQSNLNPHHVLGSSEYQGKISNSSNVVSCSSFTKTQQGRPVFNQHFQSSTTPHTVVSSPLYSGVSESVINSNLGSLCSSTVLPVTRQDSYVRRSEHNPSLFQQTSCANSNTQSSFPHSVSSQIFSSPSQNIFRNQLVSSLAQSSYQVSERLKSTEVNKPVSGQNVQAASTDSISSPTKTNSPHLLNSIPEKPLDQQSVIQSSLEKVSSEGDDNSNHSGLVSENLQENSGTSVLLEHANVKSENHDSGVGSSSERSDDTPSEPGDGEFRAGTNCSESEEATKASKRLVNCKSDIGSDSTSANTITVGYMMSTVDTVCQPKSSEQRDLHEGIKTTTISLVKDASNSKVDPFYDTHSSDKGSLLPSNYPLTSVDWIGKESLMQPSTASGKLRLNGPSFIDKEEGLNVTQKEQRHETMTNGPSSKEVEDMLMTMADLQGKREQLPSKHNAIYNRHDLHLQHEVLEEMAKLQQLAASKDLSNIQGKLGKEEPSESLACSEERPDQIPYFDMEELVNGKLFGNGTSSIDKTGTNITSIYSKRSSPVNVNMLNHIYAPGLPLPRRLTESVQRLVKPLPATESSMPQMKHCKSPGAGSPRAGSGMNGPSRMAMHSGTRSPGASIPKLVPNDKHSLLSGGLDLAGLPKLSPNSIPHSDFTPDNILNDSASKMLGFNSDFFSKDGQNHGFISSCHVSPPLLTDSLAHTHKTLSQSYPPHKSRALSNSAPFFDIFSHMKPHQSSLSDSTTSLSLQEPSTQMSKSSWESAISHQSQVHASAQGKGQYVLSTSKTGIQTESFPASTFNSSTFSLNHVPASEAQKKNQETLTLSKSSKMHEVSSISSPDHSSSISPTSLSNLEGIESSSLSNTSVSILENATGTNASTSWTKISLSNGSNISSVNQKIAISTPNNVPYLTLSSNSVTSSNALSAKSFTSRMTPRVSNTLLPGSSVRDTSDSLIEKPSLVKSEKSLSPRALSKSESTHKSSSAPTTLGRNLFEIVSCDLTSLPHNVVQTSRSKALDTLVSHSSSKSVLDLNHAQDLNIQSSKAQRKIAESTLGSISPQLNYNSDILLNSSHSIRTNETPSTSLPAQVVHLDFPHLPPTVSEAPVRNPVTDHVLQVGQKMGKSPSVSPKISKSHNWNTATTNPSSTAPFPMKSVSMSKIDPLTHAAASVTSDKSITSIQKQNTSLLIKEPILETLASSLRLSLNTRPEDQTKVTSSSLSNSSSTFTAGAKEEGRELNMKTLLPPTFSNKTPVPSSSEPDFGDASKQISRKRSFNEMEAEEKEDSDRSASNHSPAKNLAIETKSESALLTSSNSETLPPTKETKDDKRPVISPAKVNCVVGQKEKEKQPVSDMKSVPLSDNKEESSQKNQTVVGNMKIVSLSHDKEESSQKDRTDARLLKSVSSSHDKEESSLKDKIFVSGMKNMFSSFNKESSEIDDLADVRILKMSPSSDIEESSQIEDQSNVSDMKSMSSSYNKEESSKKEQADFGDLKSVFSSYDKEKSSQFDQSFTIKHVESSDLPENIIDQSQNEKAKDSSSTMSMSLPSLPDSGNTIIKNQNESSIDEKRGNELEEFEGNKSESVEAIVPDVKILLSQKIAGKDGEEFEENLAEKESNCLKAENLVESKNYQTMDVSFGQNKPKRDAVESVASQDPLLVPGNMEHKLEEGARRGQRTKRQFYEYVPEKSIDQTYFDTPILSGRTRSRNKPSEPANPDQAASQDGMTNATGPSDAQSATLVPGGKADTSGDAGGNKRSTRSLRTKDHPQESSASKRRKLQPRDHR